jgi:hypothetical protein
MTRKAQQPTRIRQVPPAPQLTVQERAAKLPKPAIDRIVTGPLELLPTYLQLHHLEVYAWDNGVMLARPVRQEGAQP